MELVNEVEACWEKDVHDDIILNNNSILWNEAGPVFIMYHHLRKRIDSRTDTLLIPEYRPSIPVSAKCKHPEHWGEYDYRDNMRIDLCVVDFKEIEKKLQSGKYDDCSYWCFEPTPIIAMEFKSLSYSMLKDPENLIKDVKMLKEMILEWETEHGYLCYVCDAEENTYDEMAEKIKQIVRKTCRTNAIDKIKLAIGSYHEGDKWDILSIS